MILSLLSLSPLAHSDLLNPPSRRRVLYNILQWRVCYSLFFARFDLDYPIECDDEYWEADDPEQAFRQPPGKPSTVTSFVHMLKLFVIMAFAHRTLYSTKKTKVLSGLSFDDGWEQRIVAQLDSSMNRWKNSLPDFCKSLNCIRL